jgi:hypothetical protein
MQFEQPFAGDQPRPEVPYATNSGGSRLQDKRIGIFPEMFDWSERFSVRSPLLPSQRWIAMAGIMSCQLGQELCIARRSFGQLCQHAFPQRGLCNDLGFGGAVRG